ISCKCESGKTIACYDGTAGTEGKGACKGGMSTCAADGSGYGACAGEVVNQAKDDCTTPDVDENCDGVLNDGCHSTAIWAKNVVATTPSGVSGSSDARLLSSVVDGSGNLILAGYFATNLDFGNGVSISPSNTSGNLFIAKFDTTGKVIWAKQFGPAPYSVQ